MRDSVIDKYNYLLFSGLDIEEKIMRSLKTPLLWSAVILLVITASANAEYQLIDLGTLGGKNSYAYSINNSGQIVGSASDSSGNQYACLFDSSGGKANTNIAPILSGYPEYRQGGAATSINNNGQIVGYTGEILGSSSAYLFDSTGGWYKTWNLYYC